MLRENKAGRTGRARPVVFLLLAAPVIAELLWGTTTVSQAAGLLFQIGLYGCGAIVIREAVVRWGGGWPSVLLLGLAYGAIEEGLLEPTWLTPRLFPHPYGVAGGVYWTYAVFNAGYHAVFSIGIPVALTEILFPAWGGRPWLHRPGLTVAGAVYLVNAAAIGVAWYTVLQKSAFRIPARVHPVQMASVAVLVVALVAAGRLVASRSAAGQRTARVSGEPGAAAPASALPRPRALGFTAAVAALLWFAILLVATSQNVLSWLPFVVPLLIVAAAVVGAVRWVVHRPSPSARQLMAACAGALVVQAVAGFVATGLHDPVNIAGKAVLNVAELIALTVLYRRLPAARPQNSPATGAAGAGGAQSSTGPELADSAAGGPGSPGGLCITTESEEPMTSTHNGPAGAVATAWEAAMADGVAALERRDFAAAYRGFRRAHGLGHSILACHLSAHSGMFVTARRERRPVKIVHYFLLIAGAALLDRDHSRERCAVCQAADHQAAGGQTVTATVRT